MSSGSQSGTRPKDIPSLRWGILGTGWMSNMFVQDLLVLRPEALAKHTITAIASSSTEKAVNFVERTWRDSTAPKPQLYNDYHGVYNNPDVDIVYVGTPHTLHKKNCLDAIAAGKHILCEKPFTINARDAKEVIDAARAKGIYIMEGVWTRFLPVISSLQEHLHIQKSIGTIQRVFVDFSLQMNLQDLPPTSRVKDPTLGAGALLDIGLYSLTLASLILGSGTVGDKHPTPTVASSMAILDGIDYSNVVVLNYPQPSGPDSVAVCTSTVQHKGSPDFCTIEGSGGTITVFGPATSIPRGFRIRRDVDSSSGVNAGDQAEETLEFSHAGVGWHFEADAVAVDISLKRTESEIMPLAETLRMLTLMDMVRKEGGLVYPQDK
ncbi:hypothetical protein B0O99DRAFT_606777 [Bisporella sp. PMI_857]|nr:hypothetical protein B0O99DRAFT_606777 [Bisporella sp. PMI_857]